MFVDNDWARCLSARKSTSGVLSAGEVWRRLWRMLSVMQHKGAEALGFASLARDPGYELKVILWSDSTAARGAAARKGLSSRARHMEVKFFVTAGRTRERAAGLPKGAYVCQPC